MERSILICEVCGRIMKPPTAMLPCKHTYCKTCIDEVTNKRGGVKCWDCGEQYRSKRHFRRNLFLEQLLTLKAIEEEIILMQADVERFPKFLENAKMPRMVTAIHYSSSSGLLYIAFHDNVFFISVVRCHFVDENVLRLNNQELLPAAAIRTHVSQNICDMTGYENRIFFSDDNRPKITQYKFKESFATATKVSKFNLILGPGSKHGDYFVSSVFIGFSGTRLSLTNDFLNETCLLVTTNTPTLLIVGTKNRLVLLKKILLPDGSPKHALFLNSKTLAVAGRTQNSYLTFFNFNFDSARRNITLQKKQFVFRKELYRFYSCLWEPCYLAHNRLNKTLFITNKGSETVKLFGVNLDSDDVVVIEDCQKLSNLVKRYDAVEYRSPLLDQYMPFEPTKITYAENVKYLFEINKVQSRIFWYNI
ncbi:hypothetical protein HELRODRAFT_189995 [Helobdella robusta]|uniref:RING-type domain-containing protein n=1 Tax=Helobdella robusta TaxID=6412 RepID=T1FRK6_HELRO|nr:hypothetical protein HELRODRAFT_189995 [Helobdella robusta]ESO11540.1 hypothetical protein HELRODRAFT_189995 [Helobdella robusta]